MKRWITLLLVCLLLTALACAETQTASEPSPVPAVIAPGERDVKLTLPLGNRSDVATALTAYTAGFSAAVGKKLSFTVQSSDETIAEGVLRDDGTLFVIAHGAGEAKLTVSAATAAGERADATVSVKVSDARRTLVLIVIGGLAVLLLVLLGRPVKKEPETPTVIVESGEAPVPSEPQK